ncbi:molecular chaperone Hsp20 [Spirochaetia bacterium]|nr:molecular chaperone Hsp20 [Spirochaetia bacterium]
MKTVTLYRPGNALGQLSAGSIGKVFNNFDRYLDSFLGDSPFDEAVDYAERIFRHGPAVDVRETEDAYHLEAELPGFDEKNVEVRLDGATLTIESSTQAASDAAEEGAKEKTGEKFLLRERRRSAFSRAFTLPENADREAITASFKNGVLNLEIKKLAESKKKVIRING